MTARSAQRCIWPGQSTVPSPRGRIATKGSTPRSGALPCVEKAEHCCKRKVRRRPQPEVAGNPALKVLMNKKYTDLKEFYIGRLKYAMRTYLLFIAIFTGCIVFCAFHFLPFMAPLKPAARAMASHGLPVLIFIMLFLAFCKINLRDMRPRIWHFILLVFQGGIFTGLALWMHYQSGNPDRIFFEEIEGLMICILCPAAAAAGVITARLGGNEPAVTTYTLLSSLLAAILIPLIFPLFTTRLTGTFFEQFLILMNKVFPVIVLPMITAIFIRVFLKKVRKFIVTYLSGYSFYIWGLTLSVVSGSTVSSIVNFTGSSSTLWMLAFMGLFATILQFACGKIIGQFFRMRISAGQSLGQKNCVFAIWVALAYMSPTAAIAPGCYVLWQNSINAWQLWYREQILRRCREHNLEPYQE